MSAGTPRSLGGEIASSCNVFVLHEVLNIVHNFLGRLESESELLLDI